MKPFMFNINILSVDAETTISGILYILIMLNTDI